MHFSPLIFGDSTLYTIANFVTFFFQLVTIYTLHPLDSLDENYNFSQ